MQARGNYLSYKIQNSTTTSICSMGKSVYIKAKNYQFYYIKLVIKVLGHAILLIPMVKYGMNREFFLLVRFLRVKLLFLKVLTITG